MTDFKEDLQNALKTLKSGGIILYPTDTIWGLGCDATNEEAVKKIYEIKRREDSKALLLLTDMPGKIQNLVSEMPDIAWDLIEMSDSPLTIIYPGAKNIAKSLIAEDGSVGIRVTNEPFSKTLCERFRIPIVSTSANISGEPSAKTFVEISDEIKSKADYIVKYRQDDTKGSEPSKIIKLGQGGLFKLIRG